MRVCAVRTGPESAVCECDSSLSPPSALQLLIVTSTCPQTLPGGARPDGRAPSAGPRGAAGWGPDGGAAKGFSLIVPTGARARQGVEGNFPLPEGVVWGVGDLSDGSRERSQGRCRRPGRSG